MEMFTRRGHFSAALDCRLGHQSTALQPLPYMGCDAGLDSELLE